MAASAATTILVKPFLNGSKRGQHAGSLRSWRRPDLAKRTISTKKTNQHAAIDCENRQKTKSSNPPELEADIKFLHQFIN
jgi:hypothetical protein